MFLAVFWIYGQKPLHEMGILKFCQKYESFKMLPIQLLIFMISAGSIPDLAPLPLLARLYRKVAHVSKTKNIIFKMSKDMTISSQILASLNQTW